MSYVVKGWCPGALRPMMSGDGLVVRVRPRMARLTAEQAQGLAKAALTHGNGLIDLTARANLQLRGIRPETHLALLDDLTLLGLIDADETVESRRNIVVSPFWVAGDATQQAVDVVSAVLAAPEFAGLPGKFGVAVDSVPAVLQAISADIRIERMDGAWLVRPDGFATGVVVRDVAGALRRLLIWFLSVGVKDGRGRMAGLSGYDLPAGFDQPMTKTKYEACPGAHVLGQTVGFEFGQMRAETLLSLASCAMRITPWRMILLEGVKMVPAIAGVITDGQDPRLRVSACTGAPGCPQGLQPTRDLARRLASSVPQGRHLHVSGCAKGCAHPKPADVTLTGAAHGFGVIRDGCAADRPSGVLTSETILFKAL